MLSRFLFAVPVALGLFLGGCASESNNAVTGDDAEVIAAGPITLANYVSHPTIKAIRADVAAIDGGNYKQDRNPGCDGTNTKWTDPSGKIRKVMEEGGEGDGSGSTTGYYGTNGKLRFLFFTFTGTTEKGGVSTSESRVYFDNNGKPIWQVTREASSPNQTAPDMSKVADTITPDDAAYKQGDGHEATYENPQKWFEIRGCGQP